MRTAVISGAVQGLTEALPISSSAHLGLLRRLQGDAGSAPDAKALDVALHVGSLAGPLRTMHGHGPYVPSLIAATIASLPAALVGGLFRPLITARFGKPHPTAAIGAAAALGVWLVDKRSPEGRTARLEDLSLKALMTMGFAQATALAPGVSRSGLVYAAARTRGLDRDSAATAAITMSIPVIVGAGALMALTHRDTRGASTTSLLAGATAAATVAVITAPLARPALTRGAGKFAVYRVALAGAILGIDRCLKQTGRAH